MKKSAKKKRKPNRKGASDFSKGVRDKYAARFAEGTNVITLAPDVAEFFPDSESVNTVLRAIVGVARKSIRKGA